MEQDVVNVNGDDTSLPEKLFKFSSKPSSKLFSNSLADWLPERLISVVCLKSPLAPTPSTYRNLRILMKETTQKLSTGILNQIHSELLLAAADSVLASFTCCKCSQPSDRVGDNSYHFNTELFPFLR